MNLDPCYSVEREFAHPIEVMWHAWTDPAVLEQWYRPLDLAVVPGSVTSEVEARDESGPGCIVIDLLNRGGSAWVRMSQFGELPAGEPDLAKAGMESSFDSLGRFLDETMADGP